MTMDTIKNRIETLRKELHQHNYNYYVLNTPLISDYEFDQLMSELILLEKDNSQFFDPNSPTQRVGNDLSKSFSQVKHRYPMLSLSNTYSEGEVTDFYDRIGRALEEEFQIIAELKYDGTSISLTYVDGKLQQAITRGDGEKGDDVTENVKTIRSIPLVLQGENYPKYFEIRGEILLPFSVFDTLNNEREEIGEQPFANPRNAAAGTLKLQNSSVVAERKLDAYFYYLLGEDLPSDNHYQNLEFAKNWGFKVSDATQKCINKEQIFDFLQYWDKRRHSLPVATDGVVLKVNSKEQQDTLGFTSKSPRWAVAYKYKAEELSTRLISVSYQVGRTGAITPVANLEPIQLSGTTVKRASLHNADIIESLDLHINDYVFVEKGGEIIPKITRVDAEKRLFAGEKIEFIQYCPECNTPLIREEGEAAFYCPNDFSCPPQIKGKIEHFISRKAMNIDGIGAETIDLFYRNNLISSVSDLYRLNKESIIGLERLGEKSAENALQGIEKSKQIPFDRVLFALGIRFIGETVAKKLAKAFKSIDNLRNASLDDLLKVDEIGIRIAQSVLHYFSELKHIQLIEELRAFGIKFEIDESESTSISSLLNGYTIVISGTFTAYSREEYKAIIESNGGKNGSSVSAKTDYLLAGENMGPAKLEKATKLGVKIINENQFLEMIKL